MRRLKINPGRCLRVAADLTVLRRFLAKVDKNGECWEWTAASDEKGYGQFWFCGRANGFNLDYCRETTGWRPTCTCPDAKPIPATVLDPFGGTGRTAVAANRLGRHCILIELNPEYAEIARRQVNDAMPLFVEASK